MNLGRWDVRLSDGDFLQTLELSSRLVENRNEGYQQFGTKRQPHSMTSPSSRTVPSRTTARSSFDQKKQINTRRSSHRIEAHRYKKLARSEGSSSNISTCGKDFNEMGDGTEM